MIDRTTRHPIPTRTLALLVLAALPAAVAAQTSIPPPGEAPGGGASALALAAARDYREAARFPASSRPVEAGRPDPVRAERTPSPHSLAGPGGAPPRLVVLSGEVSFTAPEAVVLHARLDGPGASPVAGAVVTGEVRDSRGVSLGQVSYADDGVAPDARAGDAVHSARFELPAEAVPALAESYLVEVLATLPDGDFRKAASGFLYSNPWARLTGRFRDEVRDGDLVILAEVEVERGGRFHLQGTLHTPGREPVGWAQAAAELEPGSHWLTLAFYGLLFHDRGAAGAFRLGTVTLATTGAMPNALGPVLEDAHRTRAYPLARFRSRPFDDPDLLQAAERLEGEGPGAR